MRRQKAARDISKRNSVRFAIATQDTFKMCFDQNPSIPNKIITKKILIEAHFQCCMCGNRFNHETDYGIVATQVSIL